MKLLGSDQVFRLAISTASTDFMTALQGCFPDRFYSTLHHCDRSATVSQNSPQTHPWGFLIISDESLDMAPALALKLLPRHAVKTTSKKYTPASCWGFCLSIQWFSLTRLEVLPKISIVTNCSRLNLRGFGQHT
ncbi:MAG: hypothetical protein KME42_16805 [Tildeniella nuda ZEHNDER 1965/U140]|jgi:hypothetical protein|nr:hypothetical protein [Tildeniella nuda ZEHNDER 1965/U140]